MGAYAVETFGGAIPIMGKRLLPPNFAQRAVNCDLLSGELRGIPVLSEIKDFGAVTTYARAVRIPARGAVATETWVGLESRRASLIPYAISNDAYLRFAILDGNDVGAPATPRFNTLARLSAGSASFLLGIPSPTAAPALTVTGGSGTTATRAYAYAFVDAYGQEGAPSAPITVTGFVDGSWDLSAMDTTVADAAERNVTTVRIYRTVFSNSGIANFRRVADISLGTATYSDTTLDEVVAENALMESASWAEPPEIEGMISGPGGFLVGWTGNSLYFSVPYRPWAWPPEFTISVDHTILNCAYVDQTLVVITASNPVFVIGSDPSAMAVAKTEAVEAGVAAPSVVAAPDGVYFASKTGLLRASPAGLQNVTQQLIAVNEWSADYGPAILSAARYETTYIALTGPGEGFMLDWRDTRVAFTELLLTTPVSMIWVDAYTGELHAMVNNKVYLWGDQTAARENLLWRSKEFVFPQPVNIGAALVEMDVGASTSEPWGLQDENSAGYTPTVTPGVTSGYSAVPNASPLNTALVNAQGAVTRPEFDVETSLTLPTGMIAWMIAYANGRRVWQGPVFNKNMVRLPSGFKSSSWEFALISSLSVTAFRIATTARELRNA